MKSARPFSGYTQIILTGIKEIILKDLSTTYFIVTKRRKVIPQRTNWGVWVSSVATPYTH